MNTGSTTLTRASAEWFRRPPDERFVSLADLHRATFERSRISRSDVVANTSLVAEGESHASSRLSLHHRDFGSLSLTDWSLGQLAAIARTPARWLREIATISGGAALAASAINLGLRHLTAQEDVQVLTLRSNEEEPRQLRALVGPDYGRIYDHQVVEMVREVNGDGRWHIPAASYQAKDPLRATTLYASDRDVFIFLVDERNPITVQAGGEVRSLFRGFMVWNSEVGHHRLGILTFLYDYVCDNRMVHGAREVKELAIRHTKGAPERFARDTRPLLRAYAEASVSEVEAELDRATRTMVGKTDHEVLDWLRRRDFTRKESEGIINLAKVEEGDARTVWQLVNGGTALARSIPHADLRVSFERRVSGLLRAA
jgi:hypothetical protein